MNKNNKLINYLKKILKKEISKNDELKENIEKSILKDIVEKENIEDEKDIKVLEESIKDSQEDMNIYVENNESSSIQEIKVNESEEDGVKDSIIKNLKVERMSNNMDDMIKIKGSNPCDITNELNQAILKVPKHLAPADLSEIKSVVNLGHIDNHENLDVAFKYTQNIPNPCGAGTIEGEALLKAVVIVATVGYSILLYNDVTKEQVYDGVQDAITAYSVYDIIPFDENKSPTDVGAEFTITKFEQLPDNPELDYYMFVIEGTVDLVEI